ncbi:MAG: hypothetical protein CVU23_09675, partial [Betaproteobacteria bacterium HGW-Betaproteobacteria-17]
MKYLILDARYEKMRHGGVVRDAAVLSAIGIGADERRRVLGVSVALSEAEVHWRGFLESLVARGLRGVEFIVSDDHAGLRAARRAVLGGATWQRCQFHLARNAIHHAPNAAIRKRIGAELRAVWNAASLAKAETALAELVAAYRDTAPKLAAWLEESVPEGLAVFTLPEPISALAYTNKAVLYRLLFDVAAETLLTIAADPRHLGARIGATLVLHTWGSALTHHPHVHGIVPGGGLAPDGERWVTCRRGFFLPVRVLSRLFRRRFIEDLEKLHRTDQLRFFGEHEGLADAQAFGRWLAPLRTCEWVVYAKRPFAGPGAVLAYLARYTHRVAISNRRLLAMDEDGVTFRWRDYRAKGRT